MAVREILVNLAVLAIASIACLIVLEFGLRAYEWSAGEFECDHNFFGLHGKNANEKLGFGLKPGIHSRYECSDNFVNSQGIRVSEPGKVYGKKERTRIITVGDSVTYGMGREYEKTYPHYLEKELRERGHDVEVINLGVSAYNFADYVEVIRTKGNELDTDIVVIGFSYPDHYVSNSNARIWFLGANSQKCKAPLIGWDADCETIHSLNNLRALVFFNKGYQNLMGSVSEPDHTDRFKKLRVDEGRDDYGDFLRAADELSRVHPPEKTVVAIFPQAIYWDEYTLAEDDKKLKDVFSERGMGTIDLYRSMRERGVKESDISDGADIVHLLPRGYEVSAEAIADHLEQAGIMKA